MANPKNALVAESHVQIDTNITSTNTLDFFFLLLHTTTVHSALGLGALD